MTNKQRIELLKLGLGQLTDEMLQRNVDHKGDMLLTGAIYDRDTELC